jgi:hypothetical protein
MIKNLPQIVLLNIVGLALFLSWYIPVNHGFWLPIDADIFYFFNQKLVESKAFLWLVALTNNRAFDGCSLLAMGMLMLSFWLKENAPGRRRIVIIGLVMLLTAVVLNQLGQALIPVKRASPTLTFTDINRAAFSMNVRTFVLVKDKKTFCSSATGEMDIPLNELIPALDINKNVDMAILPGTPMVPNKPAIVIWYRNPLLKNSGVFAALNLNLTPSLFYSSRQEDYDGVALIIGNTALSTFSSRLMNVNELTDMPVRETKIAGIPLTVRLYADDWTWNDVWYAFLLGGMSGTVVGLLCYYLMSVRMRPGREIMTAIKREQFYVAYQPVVDTQALRVTGLEVLLRWRHPVAGEIPPDAFINFAESQKMIVPLTQHLFELIARDAAELEKVIQKVNKRGWSIKVQLSETHAIHSFT